MGSSFSQSSLFSLLPEPKKPWSEFILSISGQSLIIAFFLWIGVLQSRVLHPPDHTYRSVELVPTPAPLNHDPQPLRAIKPAFVAHIDPPSEALRLPASQRRMVATPAPETAPEIKIAERKPDPLPPSTVPAIPKQLVRTNVFSTGSSANQTVAKTPDQVQTGGFGDPNGVPAKANNGKAVNIAQLGSFDLPAGAGSGNGTGGSNGARGVIASAGFGNGVSTGDGSGTVSSARGTVKQAGFGDADVAAPPTVHSRAAEAAAKLTPAEILSKPVPAYTQEARNLKIEGEVLLEVVLQASGQIHVVRVVHGLGHGLDDSAVRAAEQIHFKPALRDGQPADSTAVLHIVFQLA